MSNSVINHSTVAICEEVTRAYADTHLQGNGHDETSDVQFTDDHNGDGANVTTRGARITSVRRRGLVGWKELIG